MNQRHKPVKKEPVGTPETTTNETKLKPLTSEEQAIAARVAAPAPDWTTITEESMGDFSLMGEPYPLPDEAAKRQGNKEFAYMFIEMTPKRIDEIRNFPVPLKWWICNATNTPYLSDRCDPVHGAVQVHDCILVFKPWWMHRKVQGAKMDLAASKDAAGVIQGKEGTEQDGKVEWKADISVGSSEVVDEVENTNDVVETEAE
jgi:hypothetical protein